MKQPKTYLLIVLLILILIAFIAIQLFKGTPTAPTPVLLPSPSPVIQIDELKILNSNITNESIEVTSVIKIRFNRPVNNETLALNISPEEAFLPLFDPTLTELTIKPTDSWQFKTTYTINILKNTKSQDGKFLDKDYQFIFTTKPYSGM